MVTANGINHEIFDLAHDLTVSVVVPHVELYATIPVTKTSWFRIVSNLSQLISIHAVLLLTGHYF
jgi:hypothetical protein